MGATADEETRRVRTAHNLSSPLCQLLGRARSAVIGLDDSRWHHHKDDSDSEDGMGIDSRALIHSFGQGAPFLEVLDCSSMRVHDIRVLSHSFLGASYPRLVASYNSTRASQMR
jgi:hypothetical protein